MLRLLLAFSLLLLQISARAGPLVRYSFDDDQLDTGPDTFRIFEYSKGTVNLSSEFPYSGYYSVEIRDAGNEGTPLSGTGLRQPWRRLRFQGYESQLKPICI